MAAPPNDSSVTRTGDRPSRRSRKRRGDHDCGLIRSPAMPPSMASAVPVTDAAAGLAR